MTALLDCIVGSWSPGLGDRHAMGWITVGVYLLAATTAARAAVRGRFPAASRGRERTFWLLAAAVLVVLAVNKQLDLQSLLTAAARCHAQANGWYDNRRSLQVAFILGIAAAGLLALVALAWLLRGTLRRTGAALLGLAFVAVFVLIRAAGFHHVDLLIDREVGGVRLNWVLELAGPALVVIAGLRAARR